MLDANRRRFLSVCGGVLTVGLAGCQGNGVDEDAPPETQIDQHLDGANGYDGSIEDHTGKSEVRVENGGTGGDYAFDPPAIRIDTGTTVRWEWVGSVAHTVTQKNGDAFDIRQSGAGETFEFRFDDTDLYLYICRPHQAFQRGAVLVE